MYDCSRDSLTHTELINYGQGIGSRVKIRVDYLGSISDPRSSQEVRTVFAKLPCGLLCESWRRESNQNVWKSGKWGATH